jgi:hypothetical protein
MGFLRRKRDAEPAAREVVDLRRPAAGAIGAPGSCPRCGGAGYLDHVDVVREIQHQHCRECGHAWERTFAELTEAERS